MAIKIFLSCENAKLEHIDKLIQSLKSKNYEFVNESTIGLNNLEQNKKLIDQCDWFMFIITKDSVKQDGHCLRELAYAKTKCVDKILPIMWEKVEEPRMSLQRTQWVAFDYTDKTDDGKDKFENEEEKVKYFNSKINEIDNILSGKVTKDTTYKIFISYGHDKYAKTLIKRIAEDLNKNNQEPWIDFEFLHGSVDWEFKIQDGIDKSRYVIIFVTPYSMRQPDGYCLNEITYSNSQEGKKILRINVELAQVPLSIINAPKLDFSECVDDKGEIIEDKYKACFELLIKALTIEGYKALQQDIFENDKFYKQLKPIENAKYIQSNSPFYGRKWLFDKYDQWVNDKKHKVWCILAGAGVGKSAFITELSKKPNIKAVHYCVFSDEKDKRSNPKNVIMSLAYQLSQQIDPYKAVLNELSNLNYDSLMKMNVDELFDYLITDPLWEVNLDKIPVKNPDTNKFEAKNIKPVVLVIDAIDEATKEDGLQNKLLNFISNKFCKTPEWLKLIITARPETNITSRLNVYNPIRIEQDEHHLADVREYLNFSLREFTDDYSQKEKNKIIDVVLKKSEGNFVYVSQIIRGLQEGSLNIKNIDKFPDGLSGYFLGQFTSPRFFEDINMYEQKFAPLLQIVLCSYEHLSNSKIADVLSTSETDINKRAEYIQSFFPTKNGFITPFHKSIVDWLFNKNLSTSNYSISKEDSHKKLANHFYDKYRNNELDDYGIKYLIKHCIESAFFDKAFELLSNIDFQNKRIKFLGKINALTAYFEELKFLYQQNAQKAHDVMISSAFLQIFAKYRKYFLTTDHYLILKEAGFDDILTDFDYSKKENVEISAGIMNYLYINNEFTKASNIFRNPLADFYEPEKIKKMDKQYVKIMLEIINKHGLIAWKVSNIDFALWDFETVLSRFIEGWESANVKKIKGSKIEPDFEEIALAYEKCGDIRYYWQENELAYSHYQNAIKNLNKYQKTIIDDKDLSKDIDIRKESLIVDICLHKIVSFDLKDIEYVKKQLPYLIKTFEEFKIKDSRYIKVLYLNLIYHIYNGDTKFVYDNYNFILNLAKSKLDIAYIEFACALAYYVDNLLDKSTKHIKFAKKSISPDEMIAWNKFSILEWKLDPKCKNKIELINQKKCPDGLWNSQAIIGWYKNFSDWIDNIKSKRHSK